mgnify:CR=1 FL=1
MKSAKSPCFAIREHLSLTGLLRSYANKGVDKPDVGPPGGMR